MRRSDCPRETELLDALRSGAWPDAAPLGLREHVEECASCDGLARLVPLLMEDCLAQAGGAAVPASSVMWWRLQTRARREAAARAMRPLATAQRLALAGAAGLLTLAAGAVVPAVGWVAAGLGTLGNGAAAAGRAFPAPTLAQLFGPVGIALVLTGALLFVVTPVALYLALDDR